MRKTTYILIFILFVSLSLETLAQVGIGNNSPDSTSVLDLTNNNHRGFLLPTASARSVMSQSPKTLYRFENFLYYKTNGGYNAISPWIYKYNQDTNLNLYYKLSGNIGIGNLNLNVPPEAPLQISTDSSISLINNGSVLIGSANNINMVINSNEIQTRNNGLQADLKINEDGGDLIFGDTVNRIDVKVSGKIKELDSESNTYYDLIPKGIITAWFGLVSNIPTGWALCDGETYLNSNGTDSTTTPDLRGRFIVSTGNNGNSSYAAHDTGGQDKVVLSINEIPNHKHNTRTTGSHSHQYTYKSPHLHDKEGDDASDSFAKGHNMYGAYTTTSYANIYHDSGGKSYAHENRPAYYSLVYIIKL